MTDETRPPEDLPLLIDLHLPAPRQGPGGNAETRRAIEFARLAGRQGLKIADIGCSSLAVSWPCPS